MLTASEVRAICIKEESNEKIYTSYIQIYTHNEKSQLVSYYYRYYDPFQYPLLFPPGENRWHDGINKVTQTCDTSKYQIYYDNEQLPSIMNMASIEGLLDMKSEVLPEGNKKTRIISCHKYYCYKLQTRKKNQM